MTTQSTEDTKMKGNPFENRFGMLVDIEYSHRKSNSLKRLIRSQARPAGYTLEILIILPYAS